MTYGQTGAPIYKVTVTSKTAKAINYRQGKTEIDFKGTTYMPLAIGKAKIENSGTGNIALELKFEKMESTAKFGPPYMTYVLWAVTPEGRARNLGPVRLDKDKAELKVTTNLVNFALIVTAEPYFAVTAPSEIVVLENEPRASTKGKVDLVDAKYELFQRGYWEEGKFDILPTGSPAGAPYELFEARNAMRIAKWQQADKYAADSFAKAEASLKQAEEYASRKKIEFKPAQMIAREATQNAEDARVVAIKRMEQERLDNERKAAAQREADAKAAQEAAERQRQAEEAARLKAQAEAAQQAEAKARADAARMKAELEARQAAEASAAAERARADAERAKAEADRARTKAEEDRLKAEEEKRALRASLLARFNQILETRDTDRGLVVNMADVLFDTGRFNLRVEAREKLAKFSGIMLNYPTLNVAVEGHTDSTGGDELNQKLSEQRAAEVAKYLSEQGGLPAANITSTGFGKTRPVADNATAKGRQQNRRVELIISGEVIGTKIQ